MQYSNSEKKSTESVDNKQEDKFVFIKESLSELVPDAVLRLGVLCGVNRVIHASSFLLCQIGLDDLSQDGNVDSSYLRCLKDFIFRATLLVKVNRIEGQLLSL